MSAIERITKFFTENLRDVFWNEEGVESMDLDDLENLIYFYNMDEELNMVCEALDILHDDAFPTEEKISVLDAIKNQCFSKRVSKRVRE